MHGLGLMVLVIGVVMASGTGNVLIPLFSVVIGGIIGELMRIEDGLNWLGAQAEARWGGPRPGQSGRLERHPGFCHLEPDILCRADDHPRQHSGWAAGRL